ncbi:hypothetical protein [Reichenbachiella sp.]|uniref:DUF6436 domain-containing protein n=1 Tax=Reichenbachiella sp. TaxID=2184521 RepID=UPI003BAE5D5A
MKTALKYAGIALFLVATFATIGYLFWKQEVQYTLPTPIPKDYSLVYVNQEVHLNNYYNQTVAIPTLYHFFNPECPCSRFNLKHYNSLKRKYSDSIRFIVVIPEFADIDLVKDYFDGDTNVIRDLNRALANELGVYSTPQAAIINRESKLYYRGNYNKARYCTDPGSNFTQMAIDSLLAGASPPAFGLLSTVSYGCGLEDKSENLFSMF